MTIALCFVALGCGVFSAVWGRLRLNVLCVLVCVGGESLAMPFLVLSEDLFMCTGPGDLLQHAGLSGAVVTGCFPFHSCVHVMHLREHVNTFWLQCGRKCVTTPAPSSRSLHCCGPGSHQRAVTCNV